MSFPKRIFRVKVDLWGCTAHPKQFNRVRIMFNSRTYMETVFDIETMKAVPTPRFEVGENALAAQLLIIQQKWAEIQKSHKRASYITSGKRLKFPPTTRNRAKYAAPTLFCTEVANITYPIKETAQDAIIWYPLSRVRSLCNACRKTMNHPMT